MAPEYFSVNDFGKLQHYKKDRGKPPWIKIYRDMWQSVEFFSLSSVGKLYYIGLGTLASEYDNKIPLNERWVQNRLGIDEPPDFKELFSSGLIVKYGVSENSPNCYQDDRASIADCYQNSVLETETETEPEKETETEKAICAEMSASAHSTPPVLSDPDFENSMEKKPPPEVFCVMPCDGKKQEFPVTRQYIAEMSRLYRGIDIELETLNALAWLKNNPKIGRAHV